MISLLFIGAAVFATGTTLPAPRSPLAGSLKQLPTSYTPEELEELNTLEETVQRFEAEGAEYRATAKALIEQKYKEKRDALFNSYERAIEELEVEQRERRERAISKFEAFLKKYPDDGQYTPDAMFRLSELYFERSYDTYFRERQAYEKAVAAWDAASSAPEPVEPVFHYEPTIASMQRLITEFPDYRLIDGAYYLLGYCLGEQGEDERAVDVYLELITRRADSKFAPEVWTRIGEYYFNTNELLRAMEAYNHVLPYVDSPFFDKAMYKLAWTHYRLADPERAPEEYQLAVDIFVKLLDFNEKSKAEGHERGGDLKVESIQYIAISYADEQWGGVDRFLAFIKSLGPRPYERDLIVALGDVYFDQTRFNDAVRAYKVVQERWPEHPEAPAVQEKIVLGLEKNRDFDKSAAEREALTSNYSEGSHWYEANKGNEKAIANANKLTEESLYTAALFHHKQAQVHKEAQKIDLAKEEYQRAADAYGGYLKRFPHNKQLYELTFYYAECLYYSLQFDLAADRYREVRDSAADEKFLEESAFSVILSYENAVKVAEAKGVFPKVAMQKSSDRPAGEKPTPKDIPELKGKMVAASDRYAELEPSSDKLPKILYKAAEVFYVYDHYDEARQRFSDILKRFPRDEVAEFSSNLIIESYLAEQNYAAVEEFSRGLLERPDAPGRKEFKGELVKFKTGAQFKLAEDLDRQNKYEAAAELYLKMIDENPGNQFADSALNNAAVAYEKVKRYDSASKLYERLVTQYPKSQLADSALFRVGLNAERFFDFNKAIEAYTKLVDRYPKSDRRADATYNAALSLENTQDYERAAKQYLRYCDLFKARDDSPQVCFRAGSVYEKMGEPKRVIATYQAFVQKYKNSAQNKDRIIEAYLKMAQAHDKLKQEREADKYYELAVHEFKRKNDPKSAPYAAESQFQLVERELDKFRTLRIAGNGKEQKKALTKKAEALKTVEEKYKAILAFKQIDWTLASLFRIGQLYQDFADSLSQAPCPPDVKKAARAMGATPEEVCDEYRVALEEKAAGIEDKAVQAFETTITKARELQVVNNWTKQTLIALNKLRSKMWPLQKDAKDFVDPNAVGSPRLVGLLPEEPPAPAPEAAPAADATPAPAAESTPDQAEAAPAAAGQP